MEESNVSYIYGLVDPRTNEIRYIGKADNFKKRLSEHLRPANLKMGGHKNHWIKQLLSINLEPEIIILEIVDSKNCYEKEKEWIRFYGRENLTNDTDGGEGVCNLSPEGKDKITGKNNHNFGKTPTEETKRKMSENHADYSGENHPLFGKSRPITTREKISLTITGTQRKNEYIGLTYRKKENSWQVRISYCGARINLGYFIYKVEAALAYNEVALELWGWRAKLNDISQEEIDKLWEIE